MHCLQTCNLRHHFATDNVLDGIDLQVPQSSIYGFLGPNGAGKTTTLRLILGLLARQHGEIRIFGKDLERDRLAILRKVGSLIESPSLYDHLTARENLALLQIVYRCPESRIAEVLILVGLASTGRKRVGQFSLGMKQRLSIAVAMLHSPDLLILDEPTNGLDPAGIAEIRELLQQLNREHGITIVVSSHLLAEIDRLVTHVGIIKRGKMLFQGTMAELKRIQQQVLSVVLRTGDDQRAMQIILEHGVSAVVEDGHIVLPPISSGEIAAITRRLVAGHVDVHEIALTRNDLETIFMGLIGARP